MKTAAILGNPIETERLFLREFVESDWPIMLKAVGTLAKATKDPTLT